jgi:hypothetical protein
MAGGIITYLLTDSIFLTLLAANLPDIYKPGNFGGTFDQVKPHLMDAYYRALDDLAQIIPEKIRQDLVEVIAQLSYPVPEERGNPRNIVSAVTQYSLQRYISIIDRLAKRVEFEKMK